MTVEQLDKLFEDFKMDFLNRTRELNNNEMKHVLESLSEFVDNSLNLVESALSPEVR